MASCGPILKRWKDRQHEPQPLHPTRRLEPLSSLGSTSIAWKDSADGRTRFLRTAAQEEWMMALIYHGTPLTPRSALRDVCQGRGICVSFYRPDDVEVAEAISPAIMFRQRRIFILAASVASWRRSYRRGAARLARLLPLVGAAPLSTRTVGCRSRCSRRAFADQRWSVERLAFRSISRRTGMAHGCACRSAAAPMRTVRSRVPRLGRRSQKRAGWLRGVSQANGRCRSGFGQSLASAAHAARDGRCVRLSICECGQHKPGAERVAL